MTGALQTCTWTPVCPDPGPNRMERREDAGGSVEFVCDLHVGQARAAGYTAVNRPPEPDKPVCVCGCPRGVHKTLLDGQRGRCIMSFRGEDGVTGACGCLEYRLGGSGLGAEDRA